MPLPAPQPRTHLHTRSVVYRGYHREDGLWDIEAEMTDTKTYTLGRNAAGAANVVGPFNDGFKRHTYSALVRLNNPAGRNSP